MAAAVRDYGQLARDIIRLVGGKDNIVSAARCATRLRLVLRSTPADAEETIKGLPGVITVVQKQGQFMVVIGNHVGDVYEVVTKELGMDEDSTEVVENHETLLNRILQMMSGVFAPICYILAAGGLLQGILIVLTMAAPSIAETGAYQIFNLISWTPFTFLPILIAVSASRHFKCNTYIAVACAMALANPTFTELANSIADGASVRFLFVNLTSVTYTSSVLPPIILIALLARLEHYLCHHLPEMIAPIFTPLICISVMVPLTIVVIGPVIQGASNAVAAGYNLLYAIAPPLAGAVVGGLWEVVVIFGVHWGMVPIVVANFAQNGCDTIQIFIQIAVISQMAAAFAIALKVRDKNLKASALSAGITAIFGITEPTIYGVTLPRKRAFIYAAIWAAIGSAVAAVLGAVQYVYAGLPGLLSTVNAMSVENPASFPACMAGAAVTIVGTIATIMILGFEDKAASTEAKQDQPTQTPAAPAETAAAGTQSADTAEAGLACSPLNGTLKPLAEVPDPTFSEEVLGKGAAILPREGRLYAPFDGTVTSLFDTKHAIGLADASGMEMLIHIGLETVALGGKGFEARVQTGQQVHKGDLLIEFDLEEIRKTCETITPVIVTNADDYSDIQVLHEMGTVKAGEALLKAVQ